MILTGLPKGKEIICPKKCYHFNRMVLIINHLEVSFEVCFRGSNDRKITFTKKGTRYAIAIITITR